MTHGQTQTRQEAVNPYSLSPMAPLHNGNLMFESQGRKIHDTPENKSCYRKAVKCYELQYSRQ